MMPHFSGMANKETFKLTNGALLKIQAALKKLTGAPRASGGFDPFACSTDIRWAFAEIVAEVDRALEPFEIAKQASVDTHEVVEGMPINPMDPGLSKRMSKCFGELAELRKKEVDVTIGRIPRSYFGNNNIAPTVLADLFPIITPP